jgi:hypothetical protein
LGFFAQGGKGFYLKPYEPKVREIQHLSELFKQGGQRIWFFCLHCLEVSFSFIRITAVPMKTSPSFIGWVGLD